MAPTSCAPSSCSARVEILNDFRSVVARPLCSKICEAKPLPPDSRLGGGNCGGGIHLLSLTEA